MSFSRAFVFTASLRDFNHKSGRFDLVFSENESLLLRDLDHSFERNKRRRGLAVARRQIAIEVEAALATRTRMTSRPACNTERNCMRSRRRAVNRVNRLHERIRFDEHLIATADVSVSRLQIRDDVGGHVGARGKDGGVQATLGINALACEAELDVLRKCSTTSHIRSSSGRIES